MKWKSGEVLRNEWRGIAKRCTDLKRNGGDLISIESEMQRPAKERQRHEAEMHRIDRNGGHNLTAPCQDCPDRHELCHAHCPKYAEYREKRDAINRAKQLDDEASSVRRRFFEGVNRRRIMQRKRLGI